MAKHKHNPNPQPPGQPAGRQFAALCFTTARGKTRVLLVTSRGTGRWIVPKGWPVEGATDAGTAALEAWEEAGVIGRTFDQCIGSYTYVKRLPKRRDQLCLAEIYPVKVLSLKGDYPERRQRRRKWFTLKKAAAEVDEPELAQILRDFDPKSLQAGVET